MATLDIRNYVEEDITTIKFSDGDSIEHKSSDVIIIRDNVCGDFCGVFVSDIPNLIKALQKAQELWGDE